MHKIELWGMQRKQNLPTGHIFVLKMDFILTKWKRFQKSIAIFVLRGNF